MAVKGAGRATWNNLEEKEVDPHERKIQMPSRARKQDHRDHTADPQTAVDVLRAASIGTMRTGEYATRNGKMGFANEGRLLIAMGQTERREGELNLENHTRGSRIMTLSSWRAI
jgi:hypothetical protein